MTRFCWEPLDFLDILGVAPVEADFGISYSYVVDQLPLTLSLKIWPLDGDVEVAIRCAGMRDPVIHLNLLSCPGARVIGDKRGKYIEFAAANLFSGRFHDAQAAPYGFQLRIEPNLQISTFSYDV